MALSYSPAQLKIARDALSVVVMACGAAIVCFWLASTAETGWRKGKLNLAAFLLMGGSILTLGSSYIYVQSGLQTQRAIGEIVSVTFHGRQTDLLIHTPDGDEVSVQASARSPYFEIGRRVRIDYQANSRLLVSATFLSQTGEPVGSYRANPKWSVYFMVAGGLVLVYIGIRRYRYDPEAAAVPTPREANPAGTFVDDQSLLHLSPLALPAKNWKNDPSSELDGAVRVDGRARNS